MARDMGGPRVPLVVVLIIHSFSHTASTEFSAHHIRISSATGTSGYAMDWRNAERFGSALRLRGGTLAEEFEQELARRRARGQKFEELTPEQYRAQGLDGASYDQNGNLQFGPPDVDMTPDEMLQACHEACNELYNMRDEDFTAMIEEGLNTIWRPLVDDPAEKIIEHGGFAKHPEKLEPAKAILEKSEEWLKMMGYFQDPRTGNWHAPQTQGEQTREAEMRRQWDAHQAQQQPQQPGLPPPAILDPHSNLPPSSPPLQPGPLDPQYSAQPGPPQPQYSAQPGPPQPQYSPAQPGPPQPPQPGQYFAPGQEPPAAPPQGHFFAPGPPT